MMHDMDNKPPVILLVEDDVLVAFLVEEMLSSNGYEVVLASDGSEAIELLEQEHHRLSALVTDIRLPAIDGWEIAAKARRLVPQLPVVYQTADSAVQWKDKGVPGSIMLQKPFNERQLIASLKHTTSGAVV
jgi:CheY-like chemotaxis protein